MMYDSTKTLLRGILQELEIADKGKWDDHIEAGKEVLYEMHQMSRPSHKAYRSDSFNGKSHGHMPVVKDVTKAIPHIKCMMIALRRKDRVTALASVKAALCEM
jgi:hypothetical protein